MPKDLPVSVPRSRYALSTRLTLPRMKIRRPAISLRSLFRRRLRVTETVCLLLLLGLGAMLLPALGRVMGQGGFDGMTPGNPGQGPGGILWEGGLPPADGSLLGGEDTHETAVPTEPSVSAEDCTLPDETAPSSSPEEDPTVTEPTHEPVTFPHESEDTAEPSADPEEPTAEPSDGTDETVKPVDTETPTREDPPADSPADTEGEPPADTVPETTVPEITVPDGCIPIQPLDMSLGERGSGYVIRESGELPPSLPTGGLWREGRTPAILIVHTHPYEGYNDGATYYDPSVGGLAQAQSPMDPEGVVALGVSLAQYLRGQGVTVIHLRVSVSPGETSSVIRERTETMIRHYCRLYPDVGLVLDLGRSAEMTDSGGILQTRAQYRGEACAQLRVTVSGGRPTDATGRDLAVALALRRALWEEEPTLSRPVRVIGGGGLAAESGEVRVLTLELGSAGNTYAQACALLAPLGDALCRILDDSSK